MSKLILASAVIFHRVSQGQLELLMTQRAATMRAFPLAWTFPGGKIDVHDFTMAEQDAAIAAKICVLREVYEELGFLVTSSQDRIQKENQQKELAHFRKALLEDNMKFSDILDKLHCRLPLDALESIGRRVPPPYAIKGFDTTFFLMELQEDVEISLTTENQDYQWVTPAAILNDWRRGEALVPPPVKDVCLTLESGVLSPHVKQVLQNQSYDETKGYPNPELHPGIEMVPLRTPTLPPATHTNCYLIGKSSFLIVDPASPYPEEQAILDRIIDIRIAQGDIPLGIALTHHHPDHVGGVSYLQEKYKLPVFAHSITADLVDFRVDHLIPDMHIWDLGHDPFTGDVWQVQAWFTPGHAPGHLCFIDLRHRVGIVGDMVAGIGSILIETPEGHMQTYLDSLARLKNGHLSLLMPAHGPLTPFAEEKCQEYIEHRLMRENKVIEALSSHPTPTSLLVPLVYPELEKKLYPLAEKSLLAHLEKLCEENQAQASSAGYSLCF